MQQHLWEDDLAKNARGVLELIDLETVVAAEG